MFGSFSVFHMLAQRLRIDVVQYDVTIATLDLAYYPDLSGIFCWFYSANFIIPWCCSVIRDFDVTLVCGEGVNIAEQGDLLGQQYRSPRDAIFTQRSDVIIVGRGIRAAVDPAAAAKQYRDAGYQAYLDLLQSSWWHIIYWRMAAIETGLAQ